jgi:hypothetical protein
VVRAVKTYNMVTHGNEEIEEHLASLLHLDLHRAATLKRTAAANDESQIMCSQLRVIIGSMGVCPAC